MGVQSFLKSALISSLNTMDAEPVVINSETGLAIIDATDSMIELDTASDKNPRSLRAVFAADAFMPVPKSGDRATARGKTWKVREVDLGQVTLSLTLQEVNRR
jgi:hypothetical protein